MISCRCGGAFLEAFFLSPALIVSFFDDVFSQWPVVFRQPACFESDPFCRIGFAAPNSDYPVETWFSGI